jgi:hypothetical protein
MVTTKAKAKLLNDAPTITTVDNLYTEKHTTLSRSNLGLIMPLADSHNHLTNIFKFSTVQLKEIELFPHGFPRIKAKQNQPGKTLAVARGNLNGLDSQR